MVTGLTSFCDTITGGGDNRDRTDEPPACKAGALPAELYPHIASLLECDAHSMA